VFCHVADVTKLLGTTKTIVADDPKAFSRVMGQYVGVSDHGTGTGRTPEVWPLIRQSKVKLQSPALASGAILVDLPGVADGNAARSNIARKYLKNCKFIWIVAPITRAVDDQIAKGAAIYLCTQRPHPDSFVTVPEDLLGDAFRMQLKSMSTSTILSLHLILITFTGSGYVCHLVIVCSN
jgi:hypothetical protein